MRGEHFEKPWQHTAEQEDEQQHGAVEIFDLSKSAFRQSVVDGFFIGGEIDHFLERLRNRVSILQDVPTIDPGEPEFRSQSEQNQNDGYTNDGHGWHEEV